MNIEESFSAVFLATAIEFMYICHAKYSGINEKNHINHRRSSFGQKYLC